MTHPVIASSALSRLSDDWLQELRSACGSIAPVWPLDQWIAVNPFWGLKHLPAQTADRVLRRRSGFSILMPPAFYREAWGGGRIRREDLEAALGEQVGLEDPDQLLAWLAKAGDVDEARCAGSILDTYEPVGEGKPVIGAVGDQIAEICAAFFDHRQAGWSATRDSINLYRFWLESSRSNLMLDADTGIIGARKYLRSAPADPTEAISLAVTTSGVSVETLGALAHFWLLQVNGWASWCRGEDWRAGLGKGGSERVWELLAITLVWEMTGHMCASVEQKVRCQTNRASLTRIPSPGHPDRLWLWHRAYEIGYQRSLWRSLSKQRHECGADSGPAAIQAVFCIDVRSEVMRRHLETALPQVRTLGFAGFFGLPIEQQVHGPFRALRRLPGLLSASYRLMDTCGSPGEDRRRNRLLDQREVVRGSVRKAKYGSLSTFTLVETTGLAWAWKLVRDSLHRPSAKVVPPPCDGRLVHAVGGDPLTDAEKAQVLAGALRGMSLTRNFAPLVVFVGHGSHTDNNPNQAGLDCGACGGQSGAVNARLAARLFNEPQVRAALSVQGIRIPDYCWAIAGEHCTLTDSVRLLDDDRVPQTHLRRLADLREGFDRAGVRARRERATALGLNGLSDEQVLAAMERRGRDWSEIRPEWGLANNAAIIFAKRDATRGADLGGRVFLHEYDADLDSDGSILEALLGAPMVVANWINLQYFASVTAPKVHGSGNKLLHSVVGGHVGVIEGNDPQLRIGLPLQSVHDGTLWRHEPVRLTVLVDAPIERIEQVLQRQRDVAELVENRWVFLCRMADQGVEQYRDGEWELVTTEEIKIGMPRGSLSDQ